MSDSGKLKQKRSLVQISSLSRDEFAEVIGPVFEHSPWIAQAAWLRRPFAGLESLQRGLCAIVQESGTERQLTLIRAHPDLVGRAAQAGTLTPASSIEQGSAGLNALSAEEIAAFQKSNREYREKFGF